MDANTHNLIESIILMEYSWKNVVRFETTLLCEKAYETNILIKLFNENHSIHKQWLTLQFKRKKLFFKKERKNDFLL